MKSISTDYLIVGSGPGGASVAKELALKGKDIVILEKGKRHKITKSKINSYSMYDKWAVFSRSKEGVIIDRAITVGGCSVVFSGNSFDPPDWLEEEIGIDLIPVARQIKKEIGIKPFSSEFTEPWIGIKRLRESADSLGVSLKPQDKFINEELCRNVCDGCMSGCRNHAKWTTREWIDDAVSNGAKIITKADVTKIIIESGKATGVLAKTDSGDLVVTAKNVIIAAGGIGTGILLQQSGIENAGGNFYMDPMNVLWGMTKEPIVEQSEMTFSYAVEEMADEKGFILGNVSGKAAWATMLMRPKKGWRAYTQFGKWNKMIGMFTKIADSPEGRVYPDGKMSKPLSVEDKGKNEAATKMAKEILIGAGVIPESILVAENIGGHPGGTAAMGNIVDEHFQVKGTKNLFVCDASVFPKSPGRPPTLMILALGRYFARNVL